QAAEVNLKRIEELRARGVAAQGEADAARAQFDKARADVAVREAQLLLARQQLAQAKGDKKTDPAKKPGPGAFNVASPVAGIVNALGDAKKPLAVGDRVEAGQVLVRLDDRRALNELRLRQAKLAAAEADAKAGAFLTKEAKSRLDRAEQ